MHDDAGRDPRVRVGGDGQLAKLGLLHAHVKLAAKQATAAKVLGPVGVSQDADELNV